LDALLPSVALACQYIIRLAILLGAIIVLVTGTILLSGKAVEQGRLKLSLSLLLAGCVLVLAGFGVLVLQTNAANADAAAKIALAHAATQHQLYFRIEPLDSEATLPAPEIIIDNGKLERRILRLNRGLNEAAIAARAARALSWPPV